MNSSTIDIVSHSDVILVVGKSDKRMRLKVNSHIMSVASPAFAAMFGPNFAEGQSLSYNSPQEVELDDDIEAMDLICKVIHFQINDLPQDIAPKLVVRIAQIVDKHTLHEVTSLTTKTWLCRNDITETEDLHYLLNAAMLLKDHASFKNITRSMVLDFPESPELQAQLVLDADFSHEMIGVIFKVNSERSRIQRDMIHILYTTLTSLIKESDCSCSCAREYTRALTNKIRALGLAPQLINQLSVADVVKAIESIARPQNEIYACDITNWYPNLQPSSIRDMLDGVKEVLKFEGLALEGEKHQSAIAN